MKISPLLERRGNKPVAIIVDAHRGRGVYVATEHAGLQWVPSSTLRDFDGIAYMLCLPSRLLSATDARQWTGYSWNGGINKLMMDGGPTVYPLASAVRGNGNTPDENVEECFTLFRWLMRRAIIPGSLSSMSWRLWRSTLDVPVCLSRRTQVGFNALYGGRQEAPYPGDYIGCQYFDITSAYPTSMAASPYPADLQSVGKHLGDGDGLALATVTIPKMEWPPLPVRLSRNALCYGYGTTPAGWWPWSDLRLAKEVGCTIEIHESLQGVNDVDLFGEWWDVVQEGRRGVALSKAVTSRLWGAFSLTQSPGYMMRWSDEGGRSLIKARLTQRQRDVPTAPHIAALTTARVRDRVYREGIIGRDDVLYVDTDAVISGGSGIGGSFGSLPGEWRVKATMVRCEIRGPQVFRHECPTCDRDHSLWHYTVAGAPSVDHAIRAFDRIKRHKGQVTAWTPGQVTLPTGPLERYAV